MNVPSLEELEVAGAMAPLETRETLTSPSPLLVLIFCLEGEDGTTGASRLKPCTD